ncbi:MAG: amidohydrolase [Xanthomonadaceae bacterium]|nr:amidohydrolase [Xanthomonadaceae bacterium]
MRYKLICLLALAAIALTTPAHGDLKERLTPAITAVEGQVINWRRDIHRHPELSNREERTSALVAAHLRALGLEVRTGVAHHGVIGMLRGGRPGPVVALRADMDALPVTERTGLPFASVNEGVMHACGHDAHTAMLMGAAQVLAGVRDDLAGTVMFVFQPAEEGPPPGEEGGASLMVREGLLEGPDAPEAIFGLHVYPYPAGHLFHKTEGFLAASDRLRIVVQGKQTHGSQPWAGIDPVTIAAQLLLALQTIPSRQLDVTTAPAVLTIGRIEGGTRWNIIPDEVVLEGTVRTYDADMRDDLLARVRRTVEGVTASAGATGTVSVEQNAPVTWNDPALTRRMVPTLVWAAGAERVSEGRAQTVAEDFAYFQEKIPGMYFLLGVNAAGVAAGEAAPNHSPEFHVNEDALITGVRALVGLAVDYLD